MGIKAKTSPDYPYFYQDTTTRINVVAASVVVIVVAECQDLYPAQYSQGGLCPGKSD